MTNELHLFIDDTGSRYPDQVALERKDGMDCFGLGGILVEKRHVESVNEAHAEFCRCWGIEVPLHSTKIRGPRGKFSWLGKKEKTEDAKRFYSDLQKLLSEQPIIGIAAVVHRPGYVARYKEKHADKLWLMDKTAYAILIERSAKYAISLGLKLRVFFEGAGEREDKAIRECHSALIATGMPFDGKNSADYDVLTAEQFKEFVFADPQERTKKTRLIQLADLFLYPMAKAGYDTDYGPYQRLIEAGKVIHCLEEPNVRNKLGVKYSCFDKI